MLAAQCLSLKRNSTVTNLVKAVIIGVGIPTVNRIVNGIDNVAIGRSVIIGRQITELCSSV